MFDIGTTAVLLDAAQDLNEALQGGAALSLIPIGIGTIVGIGIAGFYGDAWSNLYCAGGSDTFSADSCGGISGI